MEEEGNMKLSDFADGEFLGNAGDAISENEVKMKYSQDWSAYNSSQACEILMFDKLLSDLVSNIPEPERERQRGRPSSSLSDSLFCAIQKVYSQLSQRRAHTLYRNAEGKDQIDHVPHFNAVGKLLNREDATPILHNLLLLSAMPLKSVEEQFAQDSSGFKTTKFNQYGVEKYGATEKKNHKWLKAHILVGVKTNVIVTAEVTDGNANDSPYFKLMVKEAYQNGFTIKEIMADAASLSRQNYDVAYDIGATAYIPFRSNTTAKSRSSPVWNKMFYYFQLNKEDFIEHYHQRSNVESTFNMVKAKFGDTLKSKNPTAQKNELLCKLIAHNIVVLIHEMHELEIIPDFCTFIPPSAPLIIEN